MSRPIQNDISQDYFEWLVELAGLKDCWGQTYWLLARDLHERDFTSVLARDENRAADGMALREDYFYDSTFPSEEFDDVICREHASVLEVMVALARRMDFEMSDPDDPSDRTSEFFFAMLENLGLDAYDDDHYVECDGFRNVRLALDILIQREYEPDGRGGLFPLTCPDDDQRDVEIWYQMMAYLQENY